MRPGSQVLKPAAIVPNRQDHLSILGLQYNADRVRLGVLADIGQPFLNDAKQRQLHRLRQAVGEMVWIDLNLSAGILLKFISQAP